MSDTESSQRSVSLTVEHLNDPIQARIESIIRDSVPDYGYGTRCEDQTSVIKDSGLFGPVVHLDASVVHEQPIEKCIEAWRSHATLARQAGFAFPAIVGAINAYLKGLRQNTIRIPSTTNIWLAQLA